MAWFCINKGLTAWRGMLGICHLVCGVFLQIGNIGIQRLVLLKQGFWGLKTSFCLKEEFGVQWFAFSQVGLWRPMACLYTNKEFGV